MKVWTTKYALTSGILEKEVKDFGNGSVKEIDYDNRYDVLYCKIDDTSNSYGDEIDSNIILLKDMDTEEITGITIMDFKRSYNVNNLIKDTLNKFFNAEEILAMVN